MDNVEKEQIVEYIKLNVEPGIKIKTGLSGALCHTFIRGLRIEMSKDIDCYRVSRYRSTKGSEITEEVIKNIESEIKLVGKFKIKPSDGKYRIVIEKRESIKDGYLELLKFIFYAEIEGLSDRKNPAYKDKVADAKGKYYSAALAFKTLLDKDLGHIIFSQYRYILYDNAKECGKSIEFKKIEKNLKNKMEKELRKRPNMNLRTKIINEYKKKIKSECHREHVVPCVLIRDRITDMIKNKKSSDEKRLLNNIASLIKRNLVVINITKKQANDLDHEERLKTSMPAGWGGWKNGDIYARLESVGIKYKLYSEK